MQVVYRSVFLEITKIHNDLLFKYSLSDRWNSVTDTTITSLFIDIKCR